MLANFIAKQAASHEKKVHIVEVGGGRGTNALCILDHLEKEYPEVYSRSRYTMMDASPTLLELQREVLLLHNGKNRSSGHDRIVDFRQIDMIDVAERSVEFLDDSADFTVLLALELLDNLPHDKISICNTSGTILQTELHWDFDANQWKEVLKPLEDELITQMVESNPFYVPKMGHKWIPTVAGGMLSRLFQARSNAAVIIADFDYLPPSDNQSKQASVSELVSRREQGEPLITDMNDTDHECYLTAPPFCDILFPTDFQLLGDFIVKILNEQSSRDNDICCPWDVIVRKQSEFLAEFGSKQVDETTSRWTGFSPLLDDFSNCSIVCVSRLDATAIQQ